MENISRIVFFIILYEYKWIFNEIYLILMMDDRRGINEPV